MKNLLLLSALALMMTSCASTDKLLEKGDYDNLIYLTTKKLSGKKKKDVYVQALEKGFDKITRRDMNRIEELRQENTPEAWEDIISIANEIQHRQDRIEPFLPLVSESGYQAKFTFVKTPKIILEAKDNAVSLYQKRLDDQVALARQGNKREARRAYDLIDHMHYINTEFNRPDLKDEMWNLGINAILVRIENNSGAMMPPYYEEELLSVDFRNAGGDWDRFYTEVNEDMNLDFEVVLHIQDIATSPEGIAEHQNLFTKQIVDGWEYVLDERGNVKKDSLGNDIKRDKYVNVNATVLETVQTKDAHIHARMDILNKRNGTRVFSQPIDVDNHFEHVARKIFGDARALNEGQKVIVPVVPYPSDLDLIFDAFKTMKPRFFDHVRNYNYSQEI